MNLKTLAAVALLTVVEAVPADAVAEDFYAGKTITFVTSTGAGGGYDAAARTLTRYMPKYIPGNPAMIIQNMPGGGHMLATNFMYNVAPKDGLHIATVNQIVPAHQVLDGRGVRYDAAKFNWIGSLGSRNAIMAVWKEAGIKTVDDARKRKVTTGATGEGSSAFRYPLIMNNVLGTQFNIVKGYKSSAEVFLAMQRREVDARSGGLQGLLSQHGDWLRDGKINIIVQIGLKRDASIPDVPLWTEVAQNDEQRRILDFIAAPIVLGYPCLAPPDVPADRMAILRHAFDMATQEKDFQEDMAKQSLEALLIGHDEVTKIVAATVGAPEDVIAKAKAAMAM